MYALLFDGELIPFWFVKYVSLDFPHFTGIHYTLYLLEISSSQHSVLT